MITKTLSKPSTAFEEKTLDEQFKNECAIKVVKVSMLGNIAWSYTDTVLDMAAHMKIVAVKKVSRLIRQIKRDYEVFRHMALKYDDKTFLNEISDLFEEINSEAFTKLCNGLDIEIGKKADLDAENVYLVKAVQMVMTVLDAMRLYDADCRTWIVSQGVSDHTFISHHFDQLAVLIPQYAGDCYDPKSESRRITARILYNEVKNIELYDENGKQI